MTLRSNVKKQSESGDKFEEEGYLARVVQIVDLGQQPQTDWQTKEEKDPLYEVQFTFEFPSVKNDSGKPKWLSKTYTFPQAWPEKTGINDKSNLCKLFKTFAPGSLKQSPHFSQYYYFNDNVWNVLLGLGVYVELGVTNSGNPKIISVSKIPSFIKEEVPALEGEPLLFDIGSATLKEWNQLYDWVQTKITRACDSETADAAMKLLDAANKEEEGKEKPAASKPSKGVKTEDFDDDIPF